MNQSQAENVEIDDILFPRVLQVVRTALRRCSVRAIVIDKTPGRRASPSGNYVRNLINLFCGLTKMAWETTGSLLNSKPMIMISSSALMR